MPDGRQWDDERFYGQSGMRGPWRCPPCPPCPPCGGRPPHRPPQRPGRPPERPCPPGWGPFCDGWRGASAESMNASQITETEQAAEDDLYMTDEPEKEQMEQDWLYMKQLYPNAARKLQRYVDDAADRLEYENSMMFDEYPDRVAIEQLVHEIIAAIQENEPNLLNETLFMDEMPEQPPAGMGPQPLPNQTWSQCVEVLIQVMVLAEMHHRRWRYFQMRRRNY